jgi:hypothetical protein
VAWVGDPISVTLPKVNEPADALAAASAVLDSIADRRVTEAEAKAINACLEAWLKAYQLTTLETRVAELEARQEVNK